MDELDFSKLLFNETPEKKHLLLLAIKLIENYQGLILLNNTINFI